MPIPRVTRSFAAPPSEQARVNHAEAEDEPFFTYFAWVILLTVIVCFGAKAIFDADGLPPITPLHHVHAVTMLAWFGLFAVQPTLFHFGHRRTHRLLGRLSPLLVLTVLVFAVQISLLNWTRTGQPLILTANGVNLILFSGFFLTALAYRRNTPVHKRLMLFATLSILGPAFGRIPEIFDADPALAAPLVLGYSLVPAVHDRWVHGRVHPATWVGVALIIAAIPIILGLSGSPGWRAVLENLLGPGGAL